MVYIVLTGFSFLLAILAITIPLETYLLCARIIVPIMWIYHPLRIKSAFTTTRPTIHELLLSGCWLLCVLPFAVIVPSLLSAYSDESSLGLIALFSYGFCFLAISTAVDSVSISLNKLFKRLENEKLAQKCVEELTKFIKILRG